MEHAIAPPPTQDSCARARRLRMALLVSRGRARCVWALLASLFTVDVTEYGLVTRFGDVVRVVAEPGLHLKAPFDRVSEAGQAPDLLAARASRISDGGQEERRGREPGHLAHRRSRALSRRLWPRDRMPTCGSPTSSSARSEPSSATIRPRP